MKNLNVFWNNAKVKNKIELLDKVLTIYSLLNFEKKDRLVDHEKKVLVYYIKNGLNDETLDKVHIDLCYKKTYIYKINKQLRDKGYLVKDKYNMKKFDLSEELKIIQERFVEKKSQGYIIQFGIE
jgi:hypothetical protein